MWIPPEPLIFWATVVLQWIGIASIILMRLCNCPKRRARCHGLFYLTLVTLGLITVLAVTVGDGSWMASGAGLSAMTVGATLDFRAEPCRDAAI